MDLSQLYGFLNQSPTGLAIAAAVLAVLVLGYTGAPLLLWTLLVGVLLVGWAASIPVLIAVAVVAVIFNLRPLRSVLVTSSVMKVMKGFMPKISDTERVALEAGEVWVEKDLFSGKPNFKNMLAEPYPDLTKDEQDFISGPVERLCGVLDDWKIWQNREIPEEAWEIIKKEKFLGMIIPKEFGGLGFSALLHSEVIQKLATRSTPACVTVMVPNSLGPAELLIHYGTDAQKKRLLPRLASGDELPCFALTEPTAGSDAGSMQAEGLLFKGDDGKLYIKLNWNKRYITLAAISTILGLAFRLKDPQNLLGKGEDVGITCALIPTNTPGVVVGRRHDPMGVPFYNCPTQGKDVVVSAEDCIVGGVKGAGRGWKMLMECLAAGRGISLPAQSVGGAKLVSRVMSAYSTIRQQFKVEIGKFEAIEEQLAQVGGFTYLMEAARRYVCGGLDKGVKPPVVTAIAKYNQTELFRKCIISGMDVLGGAAISRGPRNLLAHAYIGTPIGITVEGANIMTRALIIFGQGALRAHPYAFKEVDAVGKGNVGEFDKAFWAHVGHVVNNTFRSFLLSVTRGAIASSPVSGPTAKYYKKLAWASASFAIMADIAMGSLGGSLKSREKITGRFADILSWMFLGFSTLKRFEVEGRRAEDLPFVNYAMNYAFNQMQDAFNGIFKNIGVPGLGWFFKIIGGWSAMNSLGSQTSDRNTHQVAALMQNNLEQRERFTQGLFISKDPLDALTRYENAFLAVKAAEKVTLTIRAAVKEKKLAKGRFPKLVEEALKQGIISQGDVAVLRKAEELRLDAIQVDDYSQEEYVGKASHSDAVGRVA